MLPKFASHVLHHTQRAAATAQNYAIRNVLGLQNQSSTTPNSLTTWSNAASGSSSGWGSAGGAKSSTGSWFYQGYNGAGRAVTQANSTANDLTTSRVDEDEDLPLRRSALVIKSRPRPRSSSLHHTGAGRLKRAETLGVLKIVQLQQARAQHTVAAAPTKAEIELGAEESAVVKSPRKSIRRRNSTASSVASIDATEATDAQAAKAEWPGVSRDVNLENEALDKVASGGDESLHYRLSQALRVQDYELALEEVKKFRETHPNPTVFDYNNALNALVSIRRNGQPMTTILETYNEMLTRQIRPNARTYKTMIIALCERDREVERVVTQMQYRIKRKLGSRTRLSTDQKHIESLRSEENFGSAMLIFEAAQTLFRTKESKRIPLGNLVYNALLRSCMLHINTDAAVRIWSVIEELDNFKPDSSCYLHLLGTYTAASDVESAKDVFVDFLHAANEDRVEWPIKDYDDKTTELLADEARPGKARATQMLIWVKMVEAYFKAHDTQSAIGLLEQMMDSKADVYFGEKDIPPPCSAVYTAFVRGFIEMGDMDSALKWFDRMLSEDAVAPVHTITPMKATPRPDQVSWRVMLDALIDSGMRKEANEKFKILCEIAERDGLEIRTVDRLCVFELNKRYFRDSEVPQTERDEIITYLLKYIFNQKFIDTLEISSVAHFSRMLIQFLSIMTKDSKWSVDAMELLERFVQAGLKVAQAAEQDYPKGAAIFRVNLEILSGLVTEAVAPILNNMHKVEPMVAKSLFHAIYSVFEETRISHYNPKLSELCIKTLKDLRARGETATLDKRDWRMFFGATARYFMLPDSDKESQLQALRTICEEAEEAGLQPARFSSILPARVCQTILQRYGDEEGMEIIKSLPKGWEHAARDSQMRATLTDVSPEAGFTEEQKNLKIDKVHSRMVDEYFPAHPNVSVHTAYARYLDGVNKGIYPLPDTIGRLIAAFGRLGELDKVHRLYKDGQSLLALYDTNKMLQSQFWYVLEDQMIVAWSHAGEVEKAHVHRQRILSQGGVPSADAYGGLIKCVRETTDDSSNALALWHEAIQLGVAPNLYLYNTIISKLSRARKADLALDLFKQMRQNRIRPSSVTYGAVIAACCRVGDAQSAEVLFEEMTAQHNFRPRIPPYNTMIQFYTHTVRDRSRALHYYNALLSTGIKPTAHTYKLLIDCFGTTEPVDVAAMEDVFNQLVADTHVQVGGVHWASLINSYGCVQKNLEKATEVFDSIASHPSTARSKAVLPDAIVYEAMINVLVTLRRTDLIPSYLDRLTSSGIHMTAYIANLLIKGYATSGDLERARAIFESLQDPPVGMAAPNNHAPHDDMQQGHVAVDAPIYREPSTWEAMVRAELGNGNREAAETLLLRVQDRHFPPAVFARISGIMLNDAVSAWFSGNEQSDGSMTQSPQ